MTRVFVAFVFVAMLIGTSATVLHHQAEFDAEKQSAPPSLRPADSGRELRISGDNPEVVSAVALDAISRYVEGQERELREREERDRLAAAAAEQARAAQVRPSVPATSTVSHGAHSDAWWSGVAVCEQGGRNDPYYGYFSFMDGSAAGKSWAEQVAMGNALLASVGHEVGPWAAACVAAGYAASPEG